MSEVVYIKHESQIILSKKIFYYLNNREKNDKNFYVINIHFFFLLRNIGQRLFVLHSSVEYSYGAIAS